MGILNVTPDSFSDGGLFNRIDQALRHTDQLIRDGADMIDIGGESTRPGSQPVLPEEELERVIPIIKEIKKRFDIPVSVDTYKGEVARQSLEEGAEIINDISGFSFDPVMMRVVERYKPVCVVMHIQGDPQTMQIQPVYQNLIEDISHFLLTQTGRVRGMGIDQIIVDPGFGFGKSLDDNYHLLRELNQFKKLDYPILAGISRKSMIGKVVDVAPDKRDPGSIALNTIALLNGASILRVHDIAGHFQALKVFEKYQSEMESHQ
jgi:dihydropteroate synthase